MLGTEDKNIYDTFLTQQKTHPHWLRLRSNQPDRKRDIQIQTALPSRLIFVQWASPNGLLFLPNTHCHSEICYVFANIFNNTQKSSPVTYMQYTVVIMKHCLLQLKDETQHHQNTVNVRCGTTLQHMKKEKSLIWNWLMWRRRWLMQWKLHQLIQEVHCNAHQQCKNCWSQKWNQNSRLRIQKQTIR